jgi:hypothetical protein
LVLLVTYVFDDTFLLFSLVLVSHSLEPKVKFVINNSISIDKAFFVNCLDAMSPDAHRLVHLLSFVVQPFSLSTILAVSNGVGIGKAKVRLFV